MDLEQSLKKIDSIVEDAKENDPEFYAEIKELFSRQHEG
jgi:hypothetical protein